MKDQFNGEPNSYKDSIMEVVTSTKLDRALVEGVLGARLDFEAAIGLPNGADDGSALRAKHANILTPEAVSAARRATDAPARFELEAKIIELETRAAREDLVAVITADLKLNGSPERAAAYESWAKGTVK